MNHRTAYLYRSREGLRLKKRVLAVALLGAAACAGVLLEGGAPSLQPGQEGVFAAATADASARPADAVTAGTASVAAGPRRVYPYSIVAGGVSGRADLAHVIKTDKVVAAHYASFEVEKAHPVAVAKPRAVHVSYRKGDQVYWTAKKVMLAEGETLLSDGKNEIRGRCGNRISEVAMLPVEAAAPSEEELDAAVDDGGDGGPLQVAAPFPGEGGRYAHQLLSFPNGAGLLAVTGGEGWHPPSGWSGGGVPSGPSSGPSYGTPTAVTGGSSALIGSTSDPGRLPTQAASAGGSTSDPGRLPTRTASAVGSTSETPRGASPADTAPAPVAAPIELADTVQPEPEPAAPAPTLPGTVLSPVAPPAIPVATLEPTGEAPEPASLWLGGIGMAAMLLLRRRQGRRA